MCLVSTMTGFPHHKLALVGRFLADFEPQILRVSKDIKNSLLFFYIFNLDHNTPIIEHSFFDVFSWRKVFFCVERVLF